MQVKHPATLGHGHYAVPGNYVRIIIICIIIVWSSNSIL